MAQVVSSQPVTMKPQVLSQAVRVGFVVDILALGQIFL